jgi:hypothetical protein
LTPPQTTGDPTGQGATIEHFRAAYAAGNSPRIVILWNRALSDDIDAAQQHVDRTTQSSSANVTANATVSGGSTTNAQPYGYGTLVQSNGGANASKSASATSSSSRDRVTTDAQQGTGARADVMSEQDFWLFQTAFSDPFVRAGARLVDRNTITRVASDKSPNITDKQRAEIAGLSGFADLFIEVLVAVNPASPSGYLFRATAKDVKTGQILADVITDGTNPAPASVEYVATDHGFEARQSQPGGANGSQVALAIMAGLSQAWQR